jgi:hypothetical protein
MPRKPRYSKGRQPRKTKTSRREIPPGVRQAIVNSDRKPDEEVQRWPDHNFTADAVRKLQKRARERAERTRSGNTRGRALADITNVANAPRYIPPTVLTRELLVRIKEKITKNRKERRKSAKQHIKELGHPCSESSFVKGCYELGYVYKKTTSKPVLTREIRDLRVKTAKFLKDTDISLIVFIDAAAIRLHDEGVDKAWQKAEEEYHDNIKAETHKDFSDGQFFGAIAYDHRQGP